MFYDVALSEVDGHTIWHALEKYQEVLQHDLDTKYDGDERWQDGEDDVFLTEEIRKAEHVLSELQEHGLQPFGTDKHPL